MHALIFEQFGPPEVLQWREVPDPVPPAGHALVRIAAAGLNFADVYRRRGAYHMDATPPWILGYEGAGTIVGLGDADHGGFAVGDRVGFADAPRANAELVAVPVDKLVALPGEISAELAAAVLLQGLTAHYLVHDSFAVRAGQTAVVHAAAGGVGLLLTQMLVAKGARVIALASSATKREAAIRAGASHAFGYDVDWVAEVRGVQAAGVDVVYESVGSTLPASMAATRNGGAVVFYGFAGGDPPAVDPRVLMDRSLTLTGGDLWNVLISAQERRRRAAELFAMMRGGALAVTIAAQVPLADGAAAHRMLEGRGTIGKLVLTTGA
ncbi:MAG TPA: quinone oxidoreductase [Kofleriaceae bacterium]|nr:quinone oxidoreductase [Kofleriaceae bacterium]